MASTFLDVNFSRGDIALFDADAFWYWEKSPTPAFYPLALYPEWTAGAGQYVSGGRLTTNIPPVSYTTSTGSSFAATPEFVPWDTAWAGHEAQCFTPNTNRDRVYVEASFRFEQSMYTQWRTYRPTQQLTQTIFMVWNNYSDGFGLYLVCDEDSDGNDTPGYHTLYFSGWGNPAYASPYFAVWENIPHATIFDGADHVFRLEWIGASVLVDASVYGSNDGYLYDNQVAADGLVAVYRDGVELAVQENLKFVMSPGQGWLPWIGDRLPYEDGAAERAYSEIGTFSWVDLIPNIGTYGYVKAGYCPGWVDIANFNEVLLDSALFNGRIPSVQMELWTGDPAATIQARLLDGDANVSVGESVEVTGTTPTKVEFDVTLNTGVHPYRLQVTSDMTDADLFCAGPGLVERPGTGYEEPITPDPPPETDRPSWWLDFDGSLAGPTHADTAHLSGAGSFQYYRWTGVSTVVDGRESPISFAGDFHGDIDPNTACRILWQGVPGATSYRVYVYNCTSNGELFDAHLHNSALVTSGGNMGPTVVVRFKDVPAVPENWGGWPPEGSMHYVPDYECDFTGDADGTEWVMWS